MQMAKKNKPTPDALARAKEMYKCEGEILHIFDLYHVTTPEAVFMMERIKWIAFNNDAARQKQKQQTPQPMPTGNMFR
jgi:hypothetical protein